MYPGPVDLRVLRYVLAVAEELSFTRAAKRLHTAQPSLSRQILELERDIGVELFRRSKRWVEVTPAGQQFAAEARRALVHSERAVTIAQQIGKLGKATYTLGYSPCIDLHLLSAIRRMKPIGSAEIVLRSGEYSQLISKLLTHECEAALMLLPVDEPELIAEPLFSERLAAVFPVSHPLASKGEVTLSKLRGQQILLAPRCYGPTFAAYLMHQLEDAGTYVTSHEAAGPEEALHLVAEGFGITLAQESLLTTAKDRVKVCRINGEMEVKTAILYHRENDSPILQRLLEAIREIRDHRLDVRGSDLPLSA